MGIASDKNWCNITFKFTESTLSLLCVTSKKNIYRGDTCPADTWEWARNLTPLPSNHSSPGNEVVCENLRGMNFAVPKYILFTALITPFWGNAVQTTKGPIEEYWKKKMCANIKLKTEKMLKGNWRGSEHAVTAQWNTRFRFRIPCPRPIFFCIQHGIVVPCDVVGSNGDSSNDYSVIGLENVTSPSTVASKLKSVPELPCTSFKLLWMKPIK